MDETGMSTVPSNVPKVISSTADKSGGKISSAEGVELVTTVCVMSTAGHYVPPALIFSRKRQKPELMQGSVMYVSDRGCVNTDIFVLWIKHFHSHLFLEAVFCRDNGIPLLSISPHSSHKVKPLDKCFFLSSENVFFFAEILPTVDVLQRTGLPRLSRCVVLCLLILEYLLTMPLLLLQ
ncbi:hypothetical protein PR048_031641 [Dryococelus australis]|uniref:DDE-1 domain-containing protein n=1 Tax=Dryococelus australis TaxID=614101 RepID=A0ABQ9G8H4_9NEOP|nr:hypothetical protein PR048_031641 [Dryococelus australis]